MKYVHITASVIGKTWLYEEIGPAGRKKLVPTYQAELGDERTGFKYLFGVTRDSAAVVFRQLKNRYGIAGECPPTRECKPYLGRLCRVPRNGRSLLLWEEGLDNQHTIVGQGETRRSSILIHRGPASSLGCMTIAGGVPGYQEWLTVASRLLPTEEHCVRVFIEPRPESHHTMHLSR